MPGCQTLGMSNRVVLETRVILACEAQIRGESEDDFIEFKSSWPEPRKSARQLGGACNSARGEDVLWIIGDPHGRIGPGEGDAANWWQAVQARFSEMPPRLDCQLNVPLPWGGSVVAMSFDTTRAPFLVTSENGGSPERDVPVRDGTRTRSAHRSELLAILASSTASARAIVTDAKASTQTTADASVILTARLQVLLVPTGPEPIFLPGGQMVAVLQLGAERVPIPLEVRMGDPKARALDEFRNPASHQKPHNPYGANFVAGGVALTGPAQVTVTTWGDISEVAPLSGEPVRLRIRLGVVPSERTVAIDVELAAVDGGGSSQEPGLTWALVKGGPGLEG